MLQEISFNNKFNKTADLLLTLGLILIIVFIKKISAFLQTLPCGGVWQGLLLIAIVAALLYIYIKRICSYRYTIFCKEPSEDELDEFGNPMQYAHPLGTVFFERVVVRKGKIYEKVQPGELVALLDPGDNGEELNSGKRIPRVSMTVMPVKTASTLVFKRNGKLRGILFHPSEEFAGYVRQFCNPAA